MQSLAILGNIGSGKTELAKSLADELDLTYVAEPIDKWIQSGFLKQYYTNPKQYAFSFQCYAFITRYKSYMDTPPNDKGRRVYDSHLISDQVFVRSLVAQGIMTETEAQWYQETCDGWIQIQGGYIPNLSIYIELDPASCLKRIIDCRKRDEETSMTVEYLAHLDTEYEKFIANTKYPIVRIDGTLCQQDVLKSALDVVRSYVP